VRTLGPERQIAANHVDIFESIGNGDEQRCIAVRTGAVREE
jgi:hypothetical protein